MQYLGSKNKIAKHLLPIILKNRKPEQYYVEPFMGGGNMIDKVEGLRIGNDINYYLIEMWKALQKGWIPPDVVTEEEYRYYKKCQEIEDPAMVAFIGFLCSFGTRWFSSFAKNNQNRNYAKVGKNSLMRQLPNMAEVELQNTTYDKLIIPANSIIYCDPPYQNTAGYKDSIDHKAFWQWCRERALEGHQVFISEYSAPDDFICIFEIEHITSLSSNNNYTKRIEKLFKFEPLF